MIRLNLDSMLTRSEPPPEYYLNTNRSNPPSWTVHRISNDSTNRIQTDSRSSLSLPVQASHIPGIKSVKSYRISAQRDNVRSIHRTSRVCLLRVGRTERVVRRCGGVVFSRRGWRSSQLLSRYPSDRFRNVGVGVYFIRASSVVKSFKVGDMVC